MNSAIKNAFCLISILSIKFILCQNQNIFLEPNLSIAFDTNSFHLKEKFSYTFYENETATFHYKKNENTVIYIKSNIPLSITNEINLDSFLHSNLTSILKEEKDNLKKIRIDNSTRKINNFTCIGFTAFNKSFKNDMSLICAFKITDFNYSQAIMLSVSKDIEQNYSLFSEFLSGIKTYSNSEIEEEFLKTQNNYKVSIVQIKDSFEFRPSTFFGKIVIDKPQNNTAIEAILEQNGSKVVFELNQDGFIYIIANDRIKGEIIKKGYVHVLNSFGKKVKIPFEFKYINN